MNIGINGFGRVGKQILKVILNNYPEINVVQINDLADLKVLSFLFKHDSVYGNYQGEVSYEENLLKIGDKNIKVTNERNLDKLEWDSSIDLVIEATGIFHQKAFASKHLKGNVKKVIITAPSNDADFTVVLGVNEQEYLPKKHFIISNASCTTNSLAPVAKVLHQKFNIQSGFMTTIHSYTSDQRILDMPHSDLRRTRAAAENIIPTSTGAAAAVGKVIPELAGKLTGISLRVPTPTVSVTDFVCYVSQVVSKEKVNMVLKQASENELKGILGYSDEPLVSKDYVGDSRSGIIDSLCTDVLDQHMIKVLSWYDNEWGYSSRVAQLADFVRKNS